MTRELDLEATAQFLTDLAMGIAAQRLYGPGHPRTGHVLANAHRSISRMLETVPGGTLVLLDLDGELIVHDQPMGHLGSQAITVGRAMRRAGVERFALRKGLLLEELDRILAFLADPSGEPPNSSHVTAGLAKLAGGESGGGEDALSPGPRVVLRDRVALAGEALEAIAAGHVEGLTVAEDVVEALDRLAVEGRPGPELLAPLEDAAAWPAVHSHNVAALAVSVARLLGLPREACLDLGVAALLHDIGRYGARDEWLADLERDDDILEGDPEHPLTGLELVLGLPAVPRLVPIVVFGHHRALDGSGRPALPGSRPAHPAASFVGAVEAFDILHTVRGPSGRMTREAVVAWLQERSGRTIDPFLVRLFRAILA